MLRQVPKEASGPQERFYRRLYESSEDCIKVLSLEGNLLEMSEHGQRLLEIPDIDKFLNVPWMTFWKSPDHRTAAENAVKSAREGTSSSFVGHFVTLGGTPKWFHVVVSPILDEAGKPEYLLSVSRDVTKQIDAEHDLRERYDREHLLMVELQRALLPTVVPSIEGLSFDAVYVPGTPALEVGGDWYDVFRLNDGRVVISVGDVCGHGLTSAIVMQRVWQSIRGGALSEINSPMEILKHADGILRHQYPELVVTAWVGIIDGSSLTYASAGHPWPLLERMGGAIEMLAGSAPPLGLLAGNDDGVTDIRVSLESAVSLVLYTDGLTEMTRDVSEGEQRLRDAVAALHDQGIPTTASVLKERLVVDPPEDDIAILTVSFNGRMS